MIRYKPIFILPLMLIIFSCSEGIEIQKTVITSGYDFTEYTQKGFLFTPEQYLDSYESIGLLDIEILPDVKKYDPNDELGEDWIKLYGNEYNYWKMKKINIQEVIDAFYEKAVKMGADAVVRLQFDNVEHSNGEVNFYSVKASGFAIKRKGAIK